MITFNTTVGRQTVQNMIDDYEFVEDNNHDIVMRPPPYLRSGTGKCQVQDTEIDGSGSAAAHIAIVLDAMNPFIRRADAGTTSEPANGAYSAINQHRTRTFYITNDLLALWTLRTFEYAVTGRLDTEKQISPNHETGAPESPIALVTTGAAVGLYRHLPDQDLKFGGSEKFSSESPNSLDKLDGEYPNPNLGVMSYMGEKIQNYKAINESNGTNKTYASLNHQRVSPRECWGALTGQLAYNDENQAFHRNGKYQLSDGVEGSNPETIDWGSRSCKCNAGMFCYKSERDKTSPGVQPGPVAAYMAGQSLSETRISIESVPALGRTGAFRIAYQLATDILVLQSIAMFNRKFIDDLADLTVEGSNDPDTGIPLFGSENAEDTDELAMWLGIKGLMQGGFLCRSNRDWTVDRSKTGRTESMSPSKVLTNVDAICCRTVQLSQILNSGFRDPYTSDGVVPAGRHMGATKILPVPVLGAGTSKRDAYEDFATLDAGPQLPVPLLENGNGATYGPEFNANGAFVDCTAVNQDAPSFTTPGLVADMLGLGRTGHAFIILNDKDPDFTDWIGSDWNEVVGRIMPGSRIGDLTAKLLVTGRDR